MKLVEGSAWELCQKPGTCTLDIEHALNEAAQQDLIDVEHQLVSVRAPEWLHMAEKPTPIIAPKPKFEKLD